MSWSVHQLTLRLLNSGCVRYTVSPCSSCTWSLLWKITEDLWWLLLVTFCLKYRIRPKVYTWFIFCCVLLLFGPGRFLSVPLEVTSRQIGHIKAETKWHICLKQKTVSFFLYEKSLNFYHISLKFVWNDSIKGTSALVRIMVWCQKDDKPLSERMKTR